MKKAGTIKKLAVYRLTQELAKEHATALAAIANQIPLIDYSAADILAEHKGDRIFHGKWEHSLLVLDENIPVSFIMAYEREAERNEQYLKHSLYISELLVAEQYQRQGIGSALITKFLEINKSFHHLEGTLLYSTQTNSAAWNQHVQNRSCLYSI